MSVKLVFKIQAIINLINGLGALFLTQFFLEQANFEVTADISTLAEFIGVTFLILALISWRIPDIAGTAINSFGKLYALGGLLWVLIVGYHILMGQVSGPTPYVNIVIIAIISILFFTQSSKSE
ncbi:MAG: hypothetical protein CML41_03025 [Rhodobacteraceae bacterium]|jgi:hypothetical protein|nr:hypothetical protein [Paracoccaceae bacterium]|tara:strand:- start:463 stop:834 length:372 start_codon:yes stop_codon:yes gene_type:complete